MLTRIDDVFFTITLQKGWRQTYFLSIWCIGETLKTKMRGVKKPLLWGLSKGEIVKGQWEEPKATRYIALTWGELGGPPLINTSILLKSSQPKSRGTQAIVRPEYVLFATKDLKFPISTPNQMTPFLLSTGRHVTYWFIPLRRPSTNRVQKKIFVIPYYAG